MDRKDKEVADLDQLVSDVVNHPSFSRGIHLALNQSFLSMSFTG